VSLLKALSMLGPGRDRVEKVPVKKSLAAILIIAAEETGGNR
jgi:hypothetical protein